MAYDEEMAERARDLIGGRGIESDERKMFGGLAFLVNGNMAVAVSGRGSLMVRVDPDDVAGLLETTEATPMEMQGRTMSGWVLVDDEDLSTEDELAPWIDRGVARAQALPSK